MSRQRLNPSDNPVNPGSDAAFVRPGPPDRGWLRRLWPFVARHRWTTVFALVLSVVAQALIGLLPLLQQRIIDHGIVAEDEPLVPLIVLLIVTGAVGFAANFGRRYLGGKFTVDVQHDIRRAIHRRLYELDFAAHDRLSVGDVMSRAAGDLTLLSQFLFSVPMLVAQVTLLVVAVVVMLILSPLLSLVVFSVIPVFAFVAVRYRDKVYPASWNDQRVSGLVAGVVDEAVNGVRVVKAFAQEDRELDHLAERAHELYQSRMRTARINATYSASLQTLPMLGQVGVLAAGGWMAIEGHITVGVFLAFASYLVQIITPVRLLSAMLAVTQQARAGSQRLYDLFDLEPSVTDAPDAVPVPAGTAGGFQLDHVSFGYPDGPDLLRDVTLSIEPGERIGIVGASGSGKTTLAYLLARFHDPTTGTVRLDGADVRGFTLESLRSDVSMVFEESFLFSTTIRENIAFGRPDATDAEVVAAARLACAHDFIAAMPAGYDTVVGERGYTLSGGQRQRIALARAALIDPAVMILDDATSAIDAHTEQAIFAGLDAGLDGRRDRDGGRGRTTVMIAHRSSTLRLVDRVIVLDAGRIVADGTSAELWRTSELYRELLTGPALSDHDPGTDAGRDTGLDPERVDPTAWPYDDGPDGGHAPQVELAALLQTMNAGRGGFGPMGGGMVTATPELLAKVEQLADLTGDPDVPRAEATAASDGSSTLVTLMRRFRWALLAVAVFVVVDGLTTLVGPLLIRHGLDSGVADGHSRVLWWMVLAFLIVQLVSWVNQVIEMRMVSRVGERMLYTLRVRTFAHLQRLSLDYYDRELGGRIMTRMTTDVEALAQLLQQGLMVALSALVSCAGVVVVLLWLDWRLALAAFAVLPILLAVTVWFQIQSARNYLLARDAVSAVNAELQESIAGVRVTQSLARTDNNADRFGGKSRRFRDLRLRAMALMSTYFAAMQLLSTVAKAVTLWYGAHLIHDGSLTAGLLIAFLLFLDQFFSPLQQLSAVFDQWVQARISLGRLDELLATPSSTPLPAHPIDPGNWSGEVVLDDVRFRYSPAAPEALRGVDLTIAPGEMVALVGTTGAGKSTFVKLVARFYDTTGGRVLVDGLDVRTLDLAAYRRHLGYVPQEPFLFAGTIRSNIAYGRPDASDVEVELATRAVGAHDLVARMPQGYLTPVTEAGRSLSAGQRQLLCLARAALVDPTILILDEATSNLDLASEAEVQRAMARAAEGRTTLLIAHRLQTARRADRIVVIDEGEVAEQGSHDELIAAGGRYASLWDTFESTNTPVAGE
ncbi:MAG TPA: ABC transporter ATP-binding protein [Ilumatobacter sp.]|nr:ABC transporter ATP-binding protein [Ilumatobacter sp.]